MFKKGVFVLLILALLLGVLLPAAPVEACNGKRCMENHRRCNTRGMARLNNPHCRVNVFELILEVLGFR